MSNGWPTVPLGEVLTLDAERVPVQPGTPYEMVGVYSFGRGLFAREPTDGANTSYKFFYRLKSDHVVMSQLFGWEGALALSSSEFAGRYVSPQFPTFRVDPNRLDRFFMGWWIRRPAFWADLGSRTKGMGDRRRTLNPEALYACVIPLPPLSEQRRIVAKIEQLASRIEEARRLKEHAQEAADVFLPSSLGVLFRDVSRHSAVLDLGSLTTQVTDGPHITPVYIEEGIPFVTVQNMVTGRLEFTNLKYISSGDHVEFCNRCRPERGDVLYSKDGATRGHPCFVDTDREFSIFVSVALIKPMRDRLDGRYLCYILRSSWIRDRMLEKSRGDMIPHIVLREIRQFPIPLPPLPEQRRIVAYLDDLQAKVDQLKTLQAQTAAELDALLPSILDRAFRGEL